MDESQLHLTVHRRELLLLCTILVCASLGPRLVDCQQQEDSWVNHGGDLDNRRWAPLEEKISKESLSSFALKWTLNTSYDVTATPSIDAHRKVLYAISSDGIIFAVKVETGELVWRVNLTQIGPSIPGLLEQTNLSPGFVRARSTPIIAGPFLVFGLRNPCYVLGLNRTTGSLVWWSSLDTHPACLITQSGTYYKGSIYVGTSSTESVAYLNPCCSFQGAFFKLDVKTGKIKWKVPMLPDNNKQPGGYAGAAVWGSSPPIDTKRNLVFIGSGNAYTVPPEVASCEAKRSVNQTHPRIPTIPDPCLPPDFHAESILAIDIDTGRVVWAQNLGGYDVWNLVCQDNSTAAPNCPQPLGIDADFGEAPLMLSTERGDLVIAGEKSGIVHALHRETGEILWQTIAGPGGGLGGASWGLTTDGKSIFTNIINSDGKDFPLAPSSTVISWGGWVALDGTTGAVLWSTGASDHQYTIAPMAYANGVVFGGSTGNVSSNKPPGTTYALDPKTGEILWSYLSPAGVSAGVSIFDGCIFQSIGFSPTSLLTLGGSLNPAASYGHSVISLCVS